MGFLLLGLEKTQPSILAYDTSGNSLMPQTHCTAQVNLMSHDTRGYRQQKVSDN